MRAGIRSRVFRDRRKFTPCSKFVTKCCLGLVRPHTRIWIVRTVAGKCGHVFRGCSIGPIVITCQWGLKAHFRTLRNIRPMQLLLSPFSSTITQACLLFLGILELVFCPPTVPSRFTSCGCSSWHLRQEQLVKSAMMSHSLAPSCWQITTLLRNAASKCLKSSVQSFVHHQDT